jgi:hypothetical protein
MNRRAAFFAFWILMAGYIAAFWVGIGSFALWILK